MSNRDAYQWWLIVLPEAKQNFDQLPRATKFAIFRQLRQLLTADDPFALPFVVMLEAKQFHRIRRFRVGDYRVFFHNISRTVNEIPACIQRGFDYHKHRYAPRCVLKFSIKNSSFCSFPHVLPDLRWQYSTFQKVES